MFFKELDLKADYEAAGLKAPEKAPSFCGLILKNYDEYSKGRKRPAVLVLPGGGYGFTSQREATPIALEFTASGMSAFILHYSVAPEVRFPAELVQVYSAIRVIRENAEEWNIDPDQIYICGFSAGGHLTASAGIFWNRDWVRKLGFVDDMHKPNGLILSYPVITSGEFAHRGSFENLLGDQYTDEFLELNSLEKQVTQDTPRCFIWHTAEDNAVPVQNSLMLASALAANQIPFELHVYPHGGHGLSLANELVCNQDGVIPKIQSWVPFAKEWIWKD